MQPACNMYYGFNKGHNIYVQEAHQEMR